MTTVHAQPEYQMRVKLPAPSGYPTEWVADERTMFPSGTFQSRRAALLQHILRNPAPNNTKSAYYELARWAAGDHAHEGVFHAAMDFIDERRDCSDFVLHGILRILYWQNRDWNRDPVKDQALLGDDVVARARESVLNFKYWPDEPGIDSLCTWTENHYILFASAAYLAGQLFPDAQFNNSGQSGAQKMAANHPRILRWLDLRYHTGFSEWLSHVYYDEDLTALLSLVDFCKDEEIVSKATMVIDLILLDMALNNFQGVYGSTHGRAYENTKKWAGNEGTADIMKLMFGMGQYSGFDCMSVINLALSQNYQMPPVIEAIAQDLRRPEMENQQRMGIKIQEAEKWGIFPETRDEHKEVHSAAEEGMTLLTLEAYLHPRTAALVMDLFDRFNWWENGFFGDLILYKSLVGLLRKSGLLKPAAKLMEWDWCRNTREEVNIITYRTPDYMLSCAQDYRPGYGGDQQHIWQATLGADAVCFTTHPAKLEGVSPNYWTGSGQLPRAAQIKSVLICIYNLHRKPAIYVPTRLFYTHAWFPKDRFDEVLEQDGWVFARKAEGYLALRSQQPIYWKDNSTPRQRDVAERKTCAAPDHTEDIEREIIAPGSRNIWICELGRRDTEGEFAEFVDHICAAVVVYNGLDVAYESPSQGRLEFGWHGPLLRNGHHVALDNYPRYANPYVHAAFAADEIDINLGNQGLKLDWQSGKRRLV